MNWIEEIRHDVSTLKQTKPELRKFGLLVGGILVLLSAAALWKSWWLFEICLVTGIAGLLLILAGMTFPAQLKALHKYWMALAIVLGSVVSRVILLVLFFAIVTPISIFARVYGKKFFPDFRDRSRGTYWIQRDKNKPINYERMY